MTLGIISGWEMEVLSVGVLAALSAALLWKPLKKFQNAGGGRDTSSDMIGKVCIVAARQYKAHAVETCIKAGLANCLAIDAEIAESLLN